MYVRPVWGWVMTLPPSVAGPCPSSTPWYPGRVGGGVNIGLLRPVHGVFSLRLSLSLALLRDVGAWTGRFVCGA